MIAVKVGVLRNHLSAYLKRVRQGEQIVISDRETPIVRIVPFSAAPSREEWGPIGPSRKFKALSKLKIGKSSCPVDVVEFLLEERRKR